MMILNTVTEKIDSIPKREGKMKTKLITTKKYYCTKLQLIASQIDQENYSKIENRQAVIVLYTEGWVCDVALIECTLSPGKSKKGWDFGREGTRGQWGTKGVSLRATWD
jgi:hypothetical protein